MPDETTQATVAVVLCTYNGALHIEEQIESLIAQTHPVAVRVFDDASTDTTVAILNQYSDKLDLKIAVNPVNLGYVANFEAGIGQTLDEGFEYIALCDQDDRWSPERISNGLQAIQSIESRYNKQVGCLAHSDLRMIDSDNHCIHTSFLKYRHYEIASERNLATVLGQNGVMGNTLLMNRALATLSLPFPDSLHVHDYWLAVLAELHGHRALINKALVDYRIHDSNASNSTNDIKFGLQKLFDGKSWAGFVKRDFRLPFKEDHRLTVIDTLLNKPSKLPEPSNEQRRLLRLFQDYLLFKKPRVVMYHSMLKAGFFRKGFRHRCRLAFSTLLTKRYDS